MGGTDPLTGARYPSGGDATTIAQYIQNAVNDLSDNAIPAFTTTGARDTAYANWVAAGNSMRDGLVCMVGGTLNAYQSGAWYGNPLVLSTYTSPFAANDVNPATALRDAHKQVRLTGLMKNTLAIQNATGTWFTLPAGYRPLIASPGVAYIEGAAQCSYMINVDGTVQGIGLLAGNSYPVPTPRYWSFNHVFTAA